MKKIFKSGFLVLISFFFASLVTLLSASTVSAQQCVPEDQVTIITGCRRVDVGDGGYCAQITSQETKDCNASTCTTDSYPIGSCGPWPGCTHYPNSNFNTSHCSSYSGSTTPTPPGGGGGGGINQCPTGQVPIPDPAFAPTYKRCQTSACNWPSYWTEDECSPSSTGQTRRMCFHMTCGTPPATQAPLQCQNIGLYNPNTWARLTATEMSRLQSGNQVYLCVGGSPTSSGIYDASRFTVNGVLSSQGTRVRPGTTNEFCLLYVMPSGVTNAAIAGEIHHSIYGWIR